MSLGTPHALCAASYVVHLPCVPRDSAQQRAEGRIDELMDLHLLPYPFLEIEEGEFWALEPMIGHRSGTRYASFSCSESLISPAETVADLEVT